MIKILIVNKSMKIGGIQRALLNLLKELDYSKYSVDLLLFKYDGELLKQLPKEIRIVRSSWRVDALSMTKDELRKSVDTKKKIYKLAMTCYCKIFNNKIPIFLTLLFQKKIKGYDIAISYCQDSNDKSVHAGYNDFVLKCVDATKKVAWVHGDYVKAGLNTKKNRKIYQQFDQIIGVSDGCSSIIKQCLPELKNKIRTCYNLHSIEEILSNSKEVPIEYKNKEDISFVSVCRLSDEKGLMRTIPLMKKLLEKGYFFKWYIVGEGNQKKELLSRIMELGLENNIKLLGYKSNPYAYIKNADCLLLPSLHEAAPMTIGEAKILGTPVLTTRYSSAEEQLVDQKEGVICENTEEGLYWALEKILKNPKCILLYKDYLKNNKYDNKVAIEQFNGLINELLK